MDGANGSGFKSSGPLTDYHIPDYILKPQVIIDNAPCCPLVVFINSKSGGQLGSGLIKTYRELLNAAQVFDLSEEAPDKVLQRLYANFEKLKSNGDTRAIEVQKNLRLIVAGGDSTASWLLGVVSDLKLSPSPPIATMPLGTVNNIPFSFGWGKKNPGTDQNAVKSFLGLVKGASEMNIDSWHIIMRMRAPQEGPCDPIAPLELPHSLHAFHRVSGFDSLNVEGYHAFRGGFWNYFSMGMDAQVSYGFHSERKINPEKFKNQLTNKGIYAKLVLKQGWFAPSLTQSASRNIAQLAKVKIMKRPGGRWEELKIPSSIRSIVCLNLPSFSGGFNPWGTPGTRKAQDRDLTEPYVNDGLIEVVGFRDAWHGLILLAPNGHGTRLAQAHRIRFEFHKGAADHTFMMVDGKPWKQPLPTDDETVVVEISPLRQVTMLANHPCNSKSIDDPTSPSHRGEGDGDSDSCKDEDEWLEGRNKFGAADSFKLLNEEEGSSGISDGTTFRERLDVLEHILLDVSAEPINLPLALLQHITDDFADTRQIGHGGFGVVYKGDLRNGSVAVKRLRNSHTIDEESFKREATSLISVKHQNIVRFLGYCANTENKAMVLPDSVETLKYVFVEIRERLLCFEYITNGSLDKYLTDELRGLEWHTRYQIIRGICDALVYLHKEKGIVHRDMKPANILLDDLMIPKITDFGISKLLDGATHAVTSNAAVSMGYCAPEFINSCVVSIKSDIYSLGVIIKEIVTGCRDDPDIENVLRRWRYRWNKSVKYPSLGYEQVTKCIDIAARCLSDSPKRRPCIWDIVTMLNELESTNEHVKNADESPVGPISAYPWELLEFDMLELNFPFEINKHIPCSLQLTNIGDDYIAFDTEITGSVLQYYVEPEKGVVPPGSSCSVIVTLHPREKIPHASICKDELVVWCVAVNGPLTAKDISDDMFDKKSGKVVDEVKLKAVVKTVTID